jgi:hypothetical protein
MGNRQKSNVSRGAFLKFVGLAAMTLEMGF